MLKEHLVKRVAVGVVAASLAVAGCLGLVGCGGSDEPAGDAAQEEQEPEVQSDYEVSIDGARLTEDYEGNSAIVVTFTWTNNSEDTTSFAAALMPTVFQNGVELETAVVVDDQYDSSGYLAEVKTGGTTEVQMAYLLEDESEVEVEVEELISLDDVVLAETTFDPASL